VTIRVTRLPEFGVNMSVYSGPVSRAELVAHYGSIDVEDAASGDRWISYFDSTADLSQLDVAAIGELRRLTATTLAQAYRGRTLRVAIVCKSAVNGPVLSTWRSYLAADPSHPSDLRLFWSLKDACDWLDLSATAGVALAAVAGEIRVDQPRPVARTFEAREIS
jgi:hypothetical protein